MSCNKSVLVVVPYKHLCDGSHLDECVDCQDHELRLSFCIVHQIEIDELHGNRGERSSQPIEVPPMTHFLLFEILRLLLTQYTVIQ